MSIRGSVLVLLLLLAHGSSSQNCDESQTYSQRNFILKGHALDSTSGVTSKQLCKEKCRSNSKCHSINFYQEKGICEVNKANHLSSPESLVPSSDGGEYVSFNERPPAKCSGKLCSSPHPCVIDKRDGDKYRCCRQGSYENLGDLIVQAYRFASALGLG